MAPICNGGESRYKLSKPRTRNIAPTLSPGESRSDLDSSFTKESSPGTNENSDTIKSRHSRKSVRESFYGDGTPLRKEFESDEDDDIEIPKTTRKKSSKSTTSLSNRASMRLSLGLSRSSTFDPRDEATDVEIDEHIHDTIKRKAQLDKMVALNQPLETTFDEFGMQERIISPIRRRSFFTPGLATRNPVDMLAKPPKATEKQEAEVEYYYYNPNLSASSPLERIAALDLANRPVTPLARATTPGDMDYGLIGRLRITNGVVSPAPSSRSYHNAARRASTLRHSVNYFDLPGTSGSADSTKAPGQYTRQSIEYQHEEESMPKIQSPGLSHDESLNYADVFGPPTVWPSFVDEYELAIRKKRSKSQPASSSPDRTSLIAQDYMSGLAENPFDIDSPYFAMQSFQAATKPSEIEADLFDDRSVRQKPSEESIQRTELVLPALSIEHDDFGERTSMMLSRIGKSSSTLDMTAINTTSHKYQTEVCKTDSGYSSSSSTNSYRKNWGCHSGLEPTDVLEARREMANDREEQNLTIKQKRRPTPVTIPTATTFQDSIFSGSYHNSTDTIPTIATSTSEFSNTSNVSTPRKLQKSRPQSQPPPSKQIAVQMHPEIDPKVIPQIPTSLAARMARRAEDYPPLEHTLPGVGHIRRTKQDFEPAPLSAPMRFPSPQPTIDRIWDQVMGPHSQRPKVVRNRHSFMDSIQPKRSHQKLAQLERASKNVSSVGDVNSFLKDGNDNKITNIQYNPPPCRSGPVPSPRIRPGMPRAKSMVGLSDHEATELSRARYSATLSATKIAKRELRQSSSVYTDPSPAMASSTWTDASPDIRQSSSVYTPATEPSPRPDIDRTSSVDTAMTQLPVFPLDEAFASLYSNPKLRALRKSSSERTFRDPGAVVGKLPRVNSASKDLPPLPPIPAAMNAKFNDEKAKKTLPLKKPLPPLPHQRRPSNDMVPRGLSPCRESGYWSESQQNKTQKRLSTVASSSCLSSKVRKSVDEERDDRSLRLQSEPPLLPPLDWQPTLPRLDRSPSPRRSGALAHRGREVRSQSPDRQRQRWTMDTKAPISRSPERSFYKWAPPREDGTQRHNIEWLTAQPRSASPQRYSDHINVPEGLVARMSGRFEGGLAYNFDPAFGIAGSAGTSNGPALARRSGELSRGYGVDLTDVPIFITPR